MNDMLAENLAHLLKGDPAVQAALAQKVGVTQPTISKWSRLAETKSTSEPEFRKIARLSRALGVSLDDLAWRDIANDPPGPASQPAGLDADKLALVLGIVEGAIADSRKRVPADFKARMIKRVYESQPTVSPDSAAAVQSALAGLLETIGND